MAYLLGLQGISVLFETEGWLVVEKPAGLSVHNATPNVLTLLKERNSKYDYHLAHRLDQETSGVLLVAKSARLAGVLQQAVQADTTEKKYVAVLRGSIEEDSARWTLPLTDKAEGRKNPQGLSADRKPCTTLVKVLNRNKYFSLVECEILTGRQHQIRKHAALAKHPIVGDGRYNDPKYNDRMAELYQTPRLFLHAHCLKIKIDGELHEFVSPVPQVFDELVPAPFC